MPLTDHVQVVHKKKNRVVVFDSLGTFYNGASALERRKTLSDTVLSWDLSYQWKGKSIGASKVLVAEEEYFLSQTQYKAYAGDLALFTTIAEQQKGAQVALEAQLAMEQMSQAYTVCGCAFV